jgi:hypothetical protein
MKSDFITSAYKMFAGCNRASFALDWDGLEMSNLEKFDFIMENFGSYGGGQDGAFTVNDRMRFPSNMYQHVTSLVKAKARTATRCYFQSGFGKIEQSMLSFAANGALVSAMETFRGMGNVGRNWTGKYAPSGVPGQDMQVLAVERFINMMFFGISRIFKASKVALMPSMTFMALSKAGMLSRCYSNRTCLKITWRII